MVPGIVKVLGHVEASHGGHHRSHLRLNSKCLIEAEQGVNLITHLASGGLGQVGHVEDRHQSRELFASDCGGGENLLDLRNQLQERF